MRNDTTNRWARGAAVAALAAGVACLDAGCSSGNVRIGEPLTEQYAGDDLEAAMEFWHALTERPITSNDEAFHAVLLFFDGTDGSADYSERVATLKSRGMLDADFNEPAEAAVSRGTLAVAIVEALDIEGGVVMRLLGPSPRYAARELQYMGIYPAGSDQQVFSGAAFIDLIAKVEDYQRRTDPETAQQIAQVQVESAYQARASRLAAMPQHTVPAE